MRHTPHGLTRYDAYSDRRRAATEEGRGAQAVQDFIIPRQTIHGMIDFWTTSLGNGSFLARRSENASYPLRLDEMMNLGPRALGTPLLAAVRWWSKKPSYVVGLVSYDSFLDQLAWKFPSEAV